MNKNIQSNVTKQDPTMSKLTNPVSSIKTKLADIGGITNSISNLAKIPMKDIAKVSIMPLGRISNKIKAFVETLGTIKKSTIKASVDAIKGFEELMSLVDSIDVKKLAKTLNRFPEKQLMGFVDTVGNVLDGLYNKITKTFNADKRKVLTESLNAIKEFTKSITGIIGKMSVIGVIGTLALPLIILGFGITAFTLTGLNIIGKVVEFMGNPAKASENKIATNNVISFAEGALAILVASMAIGAFLTFVPGGIKMLGYGLAAVVGTVITFGIISRVLDKVTGGSQTETNMANVKNLLLFAGGTILIAVASIGLGKLIEKSEYAILIGLGATFSIMGAFVGIAWLLSKSQKTLENAKSPIRDVLLLGFGSLLLSGIMFLLGKRIAEAGGWKEMGNAMGAVAAVITEFGVISGILGATKSIIQKGALAYGLILGLGYFSIKLTNSVIDLGTTMQKAGGWKTIGPAMGAVAAIIGEFSLIATAIGGLMMIPFLPLVMGAGIATITALSIAALSIAAAGNKIMDLSAKMKENGGIAEPMKNLRIFINESRNLMQSMSKMGRGINFFSINKTLYSLNGVLFTMSKFAKILFGVGGKAGYMKSITGYDAKGNPIYDPEGIDIKLTSTNLAEGFATFTEIILTKLDELKDKVAKFNAIAAITAIMNPVSKFTEILKAFATDKEGQIQIINIGKDGKIISKEIIDIPKVSTSIASGFATFTDIMLTSLQSMDSSFKDVWKSIKIAAIMSPIVELVDNMKNVLDEDSRPKMIKNAEAISDGLTVLREKVFEQLKDFENLPSKKTIVKGVESIQKFGTLIRDTFESAEYRDMFSANIKAIAEGLTTLNSDVLINLCAYDKTPSKNTVIRGTESIVEFAQRIAGVFETDMQSNRFLTNVTAAEIGISKLGNLYLSNNTVSLNKVLPVLTKNHTEFISKMAKELDKIKDPLKKYTESVEKLANAYEKLNSHFNADGKLVLTLDESTVNNTTYNIDKNSIGAITETLDETLTNIIPKMADAIRNVIDGSQLNVPEIKLPNGRIPAMILDVEAGSGF